MFGRQPKYATLMMVELVTYQQQVQAKLAELQGFIETNLVKTAQAQNSHIKETQFGFSFQQQES